MEQIQLTEDAAVHAVPQAHAPEDATRQALADAAAQAAKWRRRRRHTMAAAKYAIAVGFAVAVAANWSSRMADALSPATAVLAVSLIALLVAVLMRPQRRNPLVQLAKSADVRSIGVLAEATQLVLPHLTRQIVPVLTRLLPQMKASDADWITPYQHACLRELLCVPAKGSVQTGRREEFLLLSSEVLPSQTLSLAILKAFEQIGDESDLPAVEALADGQGPARKDAAVREAASECLPHLRLRAEARRQEQILLRPAEAAEPAGTLVRPATHAGAGADAALLRVAEHLDASGAPDGG